jgi:hypothetical protein
MVAYFMAAKIDNTASPIQKGAPNRPLMIQFDSLPTSSPQRPASRNQSRSQRVNQSRFERANQSSQGASNNSRNSRLISHIAKINRRKIKHSAPSAPLRKERAEVIVFLVDTHVEIEKGFSPSESATSQNLSRYTFDMFAKTKKGGV